MAQLERLTDLVAAFPRQRVVGVGDLVLDQYRRGTAVGLSPEAPAVDLLNPGLVETPGGAANVAWNIGRLGAEVQMLGVVGHDAAADALRRLLAATPGVSLDAVEDASRPTTLKLRYYHGPFQVLRVSHESRDPLGSEVLEKLSALLAGELDTVGALFVEDYGKGVVTQELARLLVDIRRSRPDLPLLFDPKVGNHRVYHPGMCSVLKPNWHEACQLVGMEPDRADRAVVARTLCTQYACAVLITLGAEGILLATGADQEPVLIPTRPREAFDVAGAGDTTLAVATVALAAGAALPEAAVLANLAGGIVVQKSGTATVSTDELLAELQHPETAAIIDQVREDLLVSA